MKATAPVVVAILAVVALLYVATAPAPPVEMTEAEIAQIEAEASQAIEDQWAGFRSAILDSDYERWKSFWTADARVIEPGVDVAGIVFFGAVRDFLAAGGEIQSFEPEASETSLHGRVAYQIGHYAETVRPPVSEPLEGEMFFFIRW
jgi:hypothetical protein